MIDLTTIQAFEILPALSELNANNIALKKNNEGYRFLLTTIAVIAIGTGIFIIIKKHQDDKEGKI
jgi:hypothetical protein